MLLLRVPTVRAGADDVADCMRGKQVHQRLGLALLHHVLSSVVGRALNLIFRALMFMVVVVVVELVIVRVAVLGHDESKMK
jgi:hypothetical protein